MFIRRILTLLFTLTFSVGCIRIEEAITLQKNGSGTVRLKVSYPQLAGKWLPGKPNADWLRPHLPGGVRLTSFEHVQGHTKLTDANGKKHELESEEFDFNFSFDEIEAMNEIRFRPDTRNEMAAAAGGTPGKEESAGISDSRDAAPPIGPFQEMTLTEEENLLRFRRVVQAARSPEEIVAGTMAAPGSAARPEVVDLGDSVLKISMICPGEVVEHNAHQIEGRTLTWKFKLTELQEHQDRDWIVSFTCRKEEKS